MKKLWPGGPYYREDTTFKITTDSVLLADFASRSRPFSRCLDMGCGGGLLSVLLHDRFPQATFDSGDLREEALQICQENYSLNRITGQVEYLDAREYRSWDRKACYQMVVCNPPYYYTGKVSANTDRAAARGDSLSPAQFSGAAAYFLQRGGSFCLVHKPEFLTDIFSAMRLADMEPKRMQLVCHRPDSRPALVLLEGRRGGSPGLTVEPCLFLAGEDGAPSWEIRKIYHMPESSAP